GENWQRIGPGERLREAVAAEEHLAASEEGRRTEDSAFGSLGGDGAEPRLVLGAERAGEDGRAVEKHAVEDSAPQLGVGDVAVLGEVGPEDLAREGPDPALVDADERDARRQRAVPRHHRRHAETETLGGADALEVAPHVPAAQRVAVERRVGESEELL